MAPQVSAETELTKTKFQYELKIIMYERRYKKMCELWKPIQGLYLKKLLSDEYSELGLLCAYKRSGKTITKNAEMRYPLFRSWPD